MHSQRAAARGVQGFIDRQEARFLPCALIVKLKVKQFRTLKLVAKQIQASGTCNPVSHNKHCQVVRIMLHLVPLTPVHAIGN